jgi:integrase
MSLQDARDEAGLLNWKYGDKKLDPRVQAKAGKATLSYILDRWRTQHVTTLKPSTQKGYAGYIRSLNKHLGTRLWRTLRVEDLLEVREQYAKSPVMFNRMMAVLNAAWLWAQGINLVDPAVASPAALVKRHPEAPRERFLDDDELHRLFEELSRLENTAAADAIMLIILTGARRSEVEDLRWENIDWKNSTASLDDSKTGHGRVLFFNVDAMEILERLRPTYGRSQGPVWQTLSLRYWWDVVRDRAELGRTRLHDLRHTFASRGLQEGVSLEVIGKLLGHTNVRTTQRYAHLANQQLQSAVDDIGKGLKS